MNTDSFKDVLNKFMPDDNSISLLADYLGYEVGKNPLDPDGEWKILFSKRVVNKNNGVIAIKPEKELNEDTSTMEVRKLSQAALEFSNTLGSSFYVRLCHNKQLINSHFYRGVSELPYKLKFDYLLTRFDK